MGSFQDALKKNGFAKSVATKAESCTNRDDQTAATDLATTSTTTYLVSSVPSSSSIMNASGQRSQNTRKEAVFLDKIGSELIQLRKACCHPQLVITIRFYFC